MQIRRIIGIACASNNNAGLDIVDYRKHTSACSGLMCLVTMRRLSHSKAQIPGPNGCSNSRPWVLIT